MIPTIVINTIVLLIGCAIITWDAYKTTPKPEKKEYPGHWPILDNTKTVKLDLTAMRTCNTDESCSKGHICADGKCVPHS